ncbi:hypothetical protein KY285_016353 [Solanum tuberosum]|nr:hypothetical protein KY285_016353 [Solanum tuberosum]
MDESAKIEKKDLNIWQDIGDIIMEEMLLWDREEHTTLPFPTEYLWDDAAQRKPPPPDVTLVVDPTTLAAEASILDPFVQQTCISTSFSTSCPYVSTFVSLFTVVRPSSYPIARPPLAHKMIYQMGSLARLANARVAQEMAEGSSGTLDTMRDEVATLRVEVVQLQSTDISMLWGEVPLPYAPVPMPEMLSLVPPSSEQPKVSMHVYSIDVDESEKADDDLATLERSLQETSEVGSSGVTTDPTLPPTVEMGTDALVEPSMSPLVIRIDAPFEASPPKTPDESAPHA